jgi:acyl-CoA synthetase (AMP-forming)/AMP-acid ligase II
MKLTLADFIAMNVRSFPDRQALEVLGDVPESYTYRDMWLRVSALADALREVEPGPHGPVAATLLPNGTDALLIYLAGQLAGCAIVPVNTRLAHPEILHIVNDSGARRVFSGGDLLGMAAAVAGAADTGATVVDAAQVPTPGGGLRDPAVPDPAKGDRLAAVFYTSGTTGAPKGAAMTNDTWLVNAMRWGWQLGLSWDSVMLVPGPLFHMSYCSFAFGTLMIGGRVRIMASFDAARACDEFTGTATTAFLVPSMTSMMIEEWERRGRPPLASMRAMMTAAASVSPEALGEAFAMFPNARITETYGWTEAGFATDEIKHPGTVADGTVGYSTLGCEIAILDPDGQPVPPGEQGEVAVKTVAHFSGYLNRPDATAAAWAGDFLRSDDIGVLEKDGRLRIIDRKNGLIIRGGENVYAAEVERVLISHPQVRDVTVVGKPDPRWGEVVVAVVVPEPGTAPDPGEVSAFCRARLAAYKCPREVRVWADLPRNSMGKIQRFIIRDRVTAEPA